MLEISVEENSDIAMVYEIEPETSEDDRNIGEIIELSSDDSLMEFDVENENSTISVLIESTQESVESVIEIADNSENSDTSESSDISVLDTEYLELRSLRDRIYQTNVEIENNRNSYNLIQNHLSELRREPENIRTYLMSFQVFAHHEDSLSTILYFSLNNGRLPESYILRRTQLLNQERNHPRVVDNTVLQRNKYFYFNQQTNNINSSISPHNTNWNIWTEDFNIEEEGMLIKLPWNHLFHQTWIENWFKEKIVWPTWRFIVPTNPWNCETWRNLVSSTN